jgi:hypothetical protein
MGSTVEFEAITIPDIRRFLSSHPQVKSKTVRSYHARQDDLAIEFKKWKQLQTA